MSPVPKTRGAYLVMTAARELREEGYDEGFAIVAPGARTVRRGALGACARGARHALGATEIRTEEATERVRHTHGVEEPQTAPHHNTDYLAAGIQSLPACILFYTDIRLLFFVAHSDTFHRPMSSCVCVSLLTIQVSSP